MKGKLTFQGYVLAPDDELFRDIQDAGIKPGDALEVDIKASNTGSQSMLSTWRLWMRETATAMNHWGCTMALFIDPRGNPKGTRPYNSDDAHAQFTSVYLGVDENGKRKTWKRSTAKPDEVVASKGDRLHCMNTHLAWCTEKGVKLTIPADSEFMKLNKEQDK